MKKNPCLTNEKLEPLPKKKIRLSEYLCHFSRDDDKHSHLRASSITVQFSATSQHTLRLHKRTLKKLHIQGRFNFNRYPGDIEEAKNTTIEFAYLFPLFCFPSL